MAMEEKNMALGHEKKLPTPKAFSLEVSPTTTILSAGALTSYKLNGTILCEYDLWHVICIVRTPGTY